MDAGLFLGLPGVKEAIPVTRPYKLVSREIKPEDTLIQVGKVTIGNGHLTIMGGPCAIESETQAMTIAEKVKEAGGHIFRGAPSNRGLPLTLFKAWDWTASRSWPR